MCSIPVVCRSLWFRLEYFPFCLQCTAVFHAPVVPTAALMAKYACDSVQFLVCTLQT